MRFRISRSSDWNRKPCEGAVEYAPEHHWDYRTFQTPEEYAERFGDWFAEGDLHQQWRDSIGRIGIVRRMKAHLTEWFIDLDETQLLAFAKEHGRIILAPPDPYRVDDDPESKAWSLEIYDDYRE